MCTQRKLHVVLGVNGTRRKLWRERNIAKELEKIRKRRRAKDDGRAKSHDMYKWGKFILMTVFCRGKKQYGIHIQSPQFFVN